MIKYEDHYNVAICLSGQIRTGRQAAKNILKFFTPPQGCAMYDRPVRVDYFMHTWNKNTWRFYKKHHQNFEILPIDNNDIDLLKDAYELKDFKVGDFKKYPNSNYPSDALFYSFDQSMILKRDYELNHGFEYDFVIKIRPDIVYDVSDQKHFDYNTVIEPGKIYTPSTSLFPSEFLRPNLDDVIFFGDSPTMDMISTLWRSISVARNELGVKDPQNHECENPDILNYLGPGTLIHRHITNSGLSYEKATSRFYVDTAIRYVVLRKTATDLNLDTVDDIDEVLKIGRDWYI